MKTGDYTAVHLLQGKEVYDTTVCERKSVADCFNSFTGDNYVREKAKWERAKQLGLYYVLAFEGTISDILQTDSYVGEGGERIVRRKDGLAQIRQLCTLVHKYQIQTWFFASRKEMSFYLLEFFMASGRWLQRQQDETP